MVALVCLCICVRIYVYPVSNMNVVYFTGFVMGSTSAPKTTGTGETSNNNTVIIATTATVGILLVVVVIAILAAVKILVRYSWLYINSSGTRVVCALVLYLCACVRASIRVCAM